MAEPQIGGVIPYLTVKGGAEAIAFYTLAFDAIEFARHPADDGVRILNSHLGVNGGSIMLSDDFPEFHGNVGAPPPAGVVLHLQVDDVDRWYARATEAGCTSVMAPADMFWGDRYGRVKCPFGHTWAMASVIVKAG